MLSTNSVKCSLLYILVTFLVATICSMLNFFTNKFSFKNKNEKIESVMEKGMVGFNVLHSIPEDEEIFANELVNISKSESQKLTSINFDEEIEEKYIKNNSNLIDRQNICFLCSNFITINKHTSIYRAFDNNICKICYIKEIRKIR